ncbi:aminopeptidase [Flavobacterium columnare]|uniref:Zn-dependent aminopeptidase n=2 Tax=Flavobacterium columnare TaxID=996 RepID=G8X5A2_FLACA|nr:M1 family metallopeptidase [Flavobacterium columnare]AEW85513.1 putative Zn-dependent aminopeptidase [Flavobacterium columnare ATCC 49512]AMO20088.1 M1 family metallopeptidase [Flavobacterium columnare]APT22732.1 aminopeptidase [Flavobacterium columnare]AUX18036.1 aminopeptidase [Flavobacterium columnare]MBF6653317.1 aminopeptidase [Flavobacterium columnare]
MKKLTFLVVALFSIFLGVAQESKSRSKSETHTDQSKFRQMYDLMATPNMYRTASGAPGPEYYQQRADYKMDVELDDKKARLYGTETITYTNNAKESLDYLWLQLDQNLFAKTSKTPLVRSEKVDPAISARAFSRTYMEEKFDGGFKIEYVKDAVGQPISYTVNETMMRINLKTPLTKGQKFVFTIKWWYNIGNYMVDGGRSGYEQFPDGNRLYVLAQFFPRMAVYNDVEGWQNMQFWGQGEFALPFGDYEVNITVPADHIMEATGTLQNRTEVLTPIQLQRYLQAEKTFDNPVIIATQEEAIEREKSWSDKKKVWRFKAENVRDFGVSTSRKFILDAMAVQLGDKKVMATSIYPKEGNPLWEQYSTKIVAHTLKSYSAKTFDYPYPKAVSVNAQDQGMEYPMICWNFGRPDEKGNYSDHLKYGMMGVIIHEVGHNFFPMIVNSDERQWTWMDEGLNTFLEYLAEIEWDPNFPTDRGPAKMIVPYMSGDQNGIEPIMSNSEVIKQFGNNAYGKPATGLNILRETIMGHELFDYAFKTYANRWKFKHPTPEDFFRTMEDASGVDLDWFWRGWFYTTDYNDIGIKEVKQFFVTNDEPVGFKAQEVTRRNRFRASGPKVYMVEKASGDFKSEMNKPFETKEIKALEDFVNANFTTEEKTKLVTPKYFYQVTFDKPGGLVMPLLVEITYEDGTMENHKFPAQIWLKNDKEVSRIFATQKIIKKIKVDPKEETADIDVSNNSWPKEEIKSKFD